MPLHGVWAILQQVVCQLIDTWSVNRLEPKQSGDCPLVQSARLIIEGLGDHSSLLVYVRHCGCIIGLDQYCLAKDFLLQMEEG